MSVASLSGGLLIYPCYLSCRHITDDTEVVLVGHKSDPPERGLGRAPPATTRRAKAFALKYNVPYIETTVKDPDTITSMFAGLAKMVE